MLCKLMVKYGPLRRFPHPCYYSDIKEIPSPKGLPLVGTAISLLIAGSVPKLHHYIDARHKELGPIFRDKLGPVSAVFLSDPDAMRFVFNNEGKYPVHVLPEPWIVYNKVHGCKRGLFFMEGEEWLQNRRKMNNILLKSNTQWIQDCCLAATKNLVIALSTDHEYVSNLENLLYKWSLEVIVTILIGEKTYTKHQDIFKDDLEELAKVVHLIFQTTSKLSLLPASLAYKFKLKRWQAFEKSVDDALQLAKGLVDKTFERKLVFDGLISKMLQENIDKELIIRIVTDLILAAGDTTAYSMQWILYLISKHSDIQEKLRQQTTTDPSHLKYIIKEALRLYPVAPFLTRVIPQNININEYTILKDTLVIFSMYTSGRNEKYFKNPAAFIPDRWIREENGNLRSMVQATIPFAIGARSCIGRKIAEIQLQTALSEIVKEFKITLKNEKDIEMILKMVAVPSKPVQIKFTKRS